MTLSTKLSSPEQAPYRLSVLPSSNPYYSIARDVSVGMDRQPRTLPERYFYDDLGSELFEKICQTNEYYPTRTEDRLLSENAAVVTRWTQPKRIVELGCGSCRKTQKLLDRPELLDSCREYTAIDISLGAIEQALPRLSARYPCLNCSAIAGDYRDALAHLPSSTRRTLFMFLGGSIGNFHPERAASFLRQIHSHARVGDNLLIGIDAIQPVDKMNRAYNDSQQYTARFNLNLLKVVNRELGADFDLNKFRHSAKYFADIGAVRMTLVSTEDQSVSIPAIDRVYHLPSGEKIVTEHSYKYTAAQVDKLLTATGWCKRHIVQPDDRSYYLVIAGVEGRPPGVE